MNDSIDALYKEENSEGGIEEDLDASKEDTTDKVLERDEIPEGNSDTDEVKRDVDDSWEGHKRQRISD